jgi:hypothetical protein
VKLNTIKTVTSRLSGLEEDGILKRISNQGLWDMEVGYAEGVIIPMDHCYRIPGRTGGQWRGSWSRMSSHLSGQLIELIEWDAYAYDLDRPKYNLD